MTARIRKTILVVDDMVSNRMYLRNILKEEYEVIEAGDGAQALQQLRRHRTRIAAVLLDLMMPVKDGVQTLKEMGMQGYLKEFPVLVITADYNAQDEARTLEMGASDMIYKPFDPVVVKRRIANLVALFSARRSMECRADDLSRSLDLTNMGMVTTLAAVTEFRSLESGRHILRIKSFTKILLKAVAERFPEYELHRREIDLISNAAVLHDVGKVTVPDKVLNKPGKLTAEEFEVMKTHTTAGSEILGKMLGTQDSEFVRYAYNICRYHHERWDGTGYPDGLKRDNIPLCAQVVGICDVYDALTTQRVYKAAIPHKQAVDMILRGECGAFNPKMMQCFVQVLEEFETCAREYADSASELTAEEMAIPAPLPASSQQDLEAERISAAKCRALYQIVNGVVIEVDMNRGTYELEYDSNGGFDRFRTGADLNEIFTEFLNTGVHPEDKLIAAKHLLSIQKDFFEEGLYRQTRRYRARRSPTEEYGWVEASHLRIYTGNPTEKKAFCIWQKIAPDGTASGEVEGLSCCREQMKKLPGVFLQCRRDRWMTMEDGLESLAELLGYSVAEMKERCRNHLVRLIVPEDREMVSSTLQKAGQYGLVAELAYRLRHKNGSAVWVTEKSRVVLEKDGEERVYRVLFDNTEARRELQETRLKLERQQLLLNNASEIFFEWDLEKDEIYSTENFKDVFGYTMKKGYLEDCLKKGKGLVCAEDVPLLRELLEKIKSGASVAEEEMRLLKADGSCLWCRVRMVAQQWENGNTASILGTITNIDADKTVVQNLKYQTERDPLTGLLNRSAATEQMEHYLQNAEGAEKAAVLILDIDNFKRVNDTYGHMAGDSVLISCGEAIRRQFRKYDIVARLGGDEFVVCLREIPSQRIAESSCEKLLESFSRDIATLVPDCEISCSVGVALYPEDGKQFLQLLQNADKALRYAKEHGKNRYAIFSEIDEEQTIYQSNRTEIDPNCRAILSNQGLIEYTLHCLYQSGDLEGTFRKVLRMVGLQTNVSRVYIFENSLNNKTCSNVFEWCNEGIESVREYEQNISYDTMLENWDSYYVQSNIFYCRDISELSDNTRKLMESRGVKSFVHCALRDDRGDFCGFVGFTDCVVNRLWTKEQLSVLESFAEVVSLSFLKKRAQDRARQWADNLTGLLNESGAWIYAVEKETYELKFGNDQLRELLPDLQIGERCYEALMNRTSPCERCPIASGKAGGKAAVVRSERLKKCLKLESRALSWDGEDAMLLIGRECQEEPGLSGGDIRG